MDAAKPGDHISGMLHTLSSLEWSVNLGPVNSEPDSVPAFLCAALNR